MGKTLYLECYSGDLSDTGNSVWDKKKMKFLYGLNIR